MAGAGEASSGVAGAGVSNQLAALVPSFDPSKDDMTIYSQKVELVLAAWPKEKITELTTRLILNAQGTAFQKLQIHHAELMANEAKSVRRVIELLGGQWGRIPLEQQYEDAEKALYQTVQQPDETNDSFLARADVLWSKLLARKMSLEELHAYCLLRGSQLNPEDKKRVIIESDTSLEGKLTVRKVSESIRLLGATFFAEMTGQKRGNRTKVYDQQALLAEEQTPEEINLAVQNQDDGDVNDEMIFSMMQEGDEDAVFVSEYESAVADVIQEDGELAAAFSMYEDARRRLAEKARNRGFWPTTRNQNTFGSKGKGKGKSKSKSSGNRRQSLQERIMNSTCRICNRKGHWKAECPFKGQSAGTSVTTPSGATANTASTMTAVTENAPAIQEPNAQMQIGLPLEFVKLPEMKPLDVSWSDQSPILYVETSGVTNPTIGTRGSSGRGRLVHLARLATQASVRSESLDPKIAQMISNKICRMSRAVETNENIPPLSTRIPEVLSSQNQVIYFATHGTHGIVDLGASKTVIGSNLVSEFLQSLNPEHRERVQRCPCQIVFRFGNQQTLTSQHAIVIPVGDLLLKIAVVPGNTPLLLSNSLMRALRASIDCEDHRLKSPRLNKPIQLQLTHKGLFLLDVNDLIQSTQSRKFLTREAEISREPTETFVTESEDKDEIAEAQKSAYDPTEVSQHANENDRNVKRETHDSQKPNSERHVQSRVQKMIEAIEQKTNQLGSSSKTSERVSSTSELKPQATDRSLAQSRVESDHVVATWSAPSSSSSHAEDGRQASNDRRCRSLDSSRSGRRSDRVWPVPQRRDIQRGMAEGSGMDVFHGEPISTKSKASASTPHEIHRTEVGQPGRKDEDSGASCKCQGTTNPSAHIEGKSSGKEGPTCRKPDESSWSRLFSGYRTRGAIRMGCRSHRFRGELREVRPSDYEPAIKECDSDRFRCDAAENAQSRECVAAGDLPSRGSTCTGSPSQCASVGAKEIQEDSCLSDPCLHQEDATHEHQETKRLRKLIVMIELELESVRKVTKPHRAQGVLGEVFCGAQSQLTHQVGQLRGKAFRFGKEQGDLASPEGRKALFRLLLEYWPRSVWFSPDCGPWSSWSNLNAQRSIDHWEHYQSLREDLLYQIALGIVLYREQLSRRDHFHWEQPARSAMLSSPMLAEIHQQTQACEFDMCRVGDLRDPQNWQHMRKRMNVLTTSPELYKELHGQICHHHHVHQAIEGTTMTKQGPILRSKFTESYPRKFARRVAKLFCQGLKQPPFRWSESVYAMHQETAKASLPDSKRRRLNPPPQRSEVVEPENTHVEGNPKRRRLDGKQSPQTSLELCQQIVQKVHQELPRVGRRIIDDPEVLNKLQEVLGSHQIVKVVACRGTDRTLGPPKGLLADEAPFRRTLLLHRTTGKIQIEKHWEDWTKLSQRQLVRKAHPCKINITAFGVNPKVNQAILPKAIDCMPKEVASSSSQKTDQSPEISDRSPSDPTTAGPMEKPEDHVEEKFVQSHRIKALSKAERSMLDKMHKNLGHPSNIRLSQALQMSGHRAEVVQASLELRCAACEKCLPPKHQRPASLRPFLDFNCKVFLDGMQWTNSQGKTFHMYHMIDAGSNYHVAIVSPSRTTQKLIEILEKHWCSWAGAPEELVVDAASEMNSDVFQEFSKQRNIRCTTIAPEAHWQNGKIERHGGFLQEMLKKVDAEENINDYETLQSALNQCTRAKNTISIRHGYTPEMIVFGKHTRLPGSILGDECIPSHEAAAENLESATESAKKFRDMLRMREIAGRAFHNADNCEALRRAVLRRSNPHRGIHEPGSWVMIWRNSISGGTWLGPMKVVIQEGNHTVWTTQAGKLYRSAPEHIRPTSESENPTNLDEEESNRHPRQQVLERIDQETSEQTVEPPENQDNDNHEENPPEDNARTPESMSQPDQEPDSPSRQETTQPDLETTEDNLEEIHGLISIDPEEAFALTAENDPLAWRYEIDCELDQPLSVRKPSNEEAVIHLATSAKKQRSEVKLSTLNAEELRQFEEAKQKEINNWISTGTIEKIMRDKVPASQILRCRWILTWKEIDDPNGPVDGEKVKRTLKPKARLVVLGFLDPAIEDIPRDSPTLNKTAKMLLLQAIATMGWDLMSFDIKAAFLQGKPQSDRILAIEPVPEMKKMMNLNDQQICQLRKGAYGLIDAPFQWFCALKEALTGLGFEASPFDTCTFVLRNPPEVWEEQGELAGILGIHVDDGVGGGNDFFKKQIQKLESKYPFGEKKMTSFTFTGIEMKQGSDKSINMSQSQYVRKIEPIKVDINRKTQEEENVTETERLHLRGLIGSLQYAAVHTRPDLATKLSLLQSAINKAKVSTLIEANKLLHEAKKHHDVSITIKPIPLKEFRFMAFSDASFASQSKPDSHSGTLIVGTHQAIQEGVQSPISPISWGCRKIQRVVTSTLAAETVSLASALDQLGWLRLFWSWIFTKTTNWKAPEKTLVNLKPAISVPTLKTDLAITDCKSLFDLATKTAMPNCAEFRVQLMARAIKEALSEGVLLRWVHSGAQLADALTKSMEATFLRETLKLGFYRLIDEDAILKARSHARDRIKWLKNQNPKE